MWNPTRSWIPDADQRKRTPPGQSLTQKWPVLHYGGIPRVNLTTWTFRCWGLVQEPLELDWQAFQQLPHTEVLADFHCVTSWSRLDNRWTGVSTRAVLDLLKLDPKATHVMIHGMNDYTTNLPIAEFADDDCLFATHHDGEPLTPEHGGPLRLIVPKLYAWKSAKWVTGLEFMSADRPGFWERLGYHMHGDPWTEERYG